MTDDRIEEQAKAFAGVNLVGYGNCPAECDCHENPEVWFCVDCYDDHKREIENDER